MKAKRPSIDRLSPTMVRMVLPCEDHGEHVVFLCSVDDTAEVLAEWVAAVGRIHGDQFSWNRLDYDDELPF